MKSDESWQKEVTKKVYNNRWIQERHRTEWILNLWIQKS